MGTFTVPLKNVIDYTGGKIGLDDYPIFDETYREALNNKIIAHYWNQEIGQESISLFTFAMARKMNEIMPLYNQHYVLSLLEIDPLSTMSIRSLTEMDSTTAVKATSEQESKSGAKSRAVASETPQTQLSDSGDYATALQDNISDTTATGGSNDEQDTTQTGINDNTVSGYQGHAPELILRARQALVNVDMLVIAELQELFMLLWQNDDEFTNNTYPFGGRRYYGLY
jgi:hypothetical protein